MAIDMNKGGGNAGALDYSNPNSSEAVREVYHFAYECKQKNVPDYQIEQHLLNRGLDMEQMSQVMRNVNQAYANRSAASNQSSQSSDNSGGGGGGIPRFVIYIGILILINILSAAFGWGFWIY